MSRQFRVQAPETQGPVPLRPPPVPNDTFTGAPRPVIDNNLSRIADALGAFNSNLQAFGTAAAAQWKQQEKIIGEDMAARRIAGMTNEQFHAGIKDGTLLAPQNPFYQIAIRNNWGQRVADDFISELEHEKRTGAFTLLPAKPGDPAPNIGDWITQRAAPHIQGLDRFAIKPFSQKLDAYRDRVIEEQRKAMDVQVNEARNGIATDQFNRVFDAYGSDPQITQNFTRSIYKELGPGTPVNLTHAELDARLLDVARRRATDPTTAATALHVLTAPRTDGEGKPLPPLAANPRYATQVKEIENAARGQLAERYIKDVKGVAAENAMHAFERADGSWWTFQDTRRQNEFRPDGHPERMFDIRANEARKQAITMFLDKSAALGGTDAERFEREYKVFAGNNEVHPVWKETFQSGAKSLLDPASLTDPTKREQAMAVGEKWIQLTERNYPYARTLLGGDKEALDAWSVYRLARVNMGRNADQSLSMAAAAVRAPESDYEAGVRQQREKEVAEKLKGMDWGTTLSSYFPSVNDTAKNVSEIQKRVLDTAAVLTRVNGLSLDDAVEAAIQATRDTSMIINGHLVSDVGGPAQQQKPYIEGFLKQAFETHGKDWGVSSPGELYVKPAGGGNFAIWIDDQLGGHQAYVQNKDGKAVPALILSQGDAPNSISRMMKIDNHIRATHAQIEQQEKLDATLRNSTAPDSALPADLAKRRSELREKYRADNAGGLYGRWMEMHSQPLPPDPSVSSREQATRETLDAIKNSARSLLPSLDALAGFARRAGDALTGWR